MDKPSLRPLIKAVMCSLLAHALVLFSVPRVALLDRDAPSPVVRATLQAAGPASSPMTPAATPAHAPERRRVLQEKGRGSMPRVASASRASSPPPRSSPTVPALVAAGPGDAGEMIGALAAEDVRRYRWALAVAARNLRQSAPAWPPGAPEVRVEVSVSLHRNLRRPVVALHRSGGTALLDDKALDMMIRAADAAELPLGLLGQDFQIVMPLLFGIGSGPAP